jgi:hypothetical protein
MKNVVKSFKAAAVAFYAGAALAGVGVATDAHALTASNDNLIFAMFGNNTEYVVNLGSTSSLLAGNNSTTINLNSTSVAATAGAGPVFFALVSWDYNPSTFALSTVTSSINQAAGSGPAFLTNVVNPFSTWTNLVNESNFPGNTIAATNPMSFSSIFGGDTATMAGAFSAAPTRALLGSTLYLLGGDVTTNALADLGSAFLSQDGLTLTVTAGAVPIPAAVILFGTGLAGLVGVARRKAVAV